MVKPFAAQYWRIDGATMSSSTPRILSGENSNAPDIIISLFDVGHQNPGIAPAVFLSRWQQRCMPSPAAAKPESRKLHRREMDCFIASAVARCATADKPLLEKTRGLTPRHSGARQR